MNPVRSLVKFFAPLCLLCCTLQAEAPASSRNLLEEWRYLMNGQFYIDHAGQDFPGMIREMSDRLITAYDRLIHFDNDREQMDADQMEELDQFFRDLTARSEQFIPLAAQEQFEERLEQLFADVDDDDEPLPLSSAAQQYYTELLSQLIDRPKDPSLLLDRSVLEMGYFQQFGLAKTLLERVLILDPSNLSAHLWLAYALDEIDADENACIVKQLMEEALEINPDRADCLSRLALANLDLGGPMTRSLWLMQHAVELEPEWPALHAALALIYVMVGDLHAADRELKAALRLPLLDSSTLGPVEHCYEHLITGRAWDDIEEELAPLRELLDTLDSYYHPTP